METDMRGTTSEKKTTWVPTGDNKDYSVCFIF